jgi:hypothetical protein
MRIFLGVMTSLVQSGDETMQTMRAYMCAACQWLENRRFYTWLHRLQSSALLVDHYGAARTCEKLFVTANDFDRRVGHLEQAREHYVRRSSLLLCDHLSTTVQQLCNNCATTVQQLCNNCATTVQQLCNNCEPFL